MSAIAKPVGVLFVCMGNICRSPTAEGVFREAVMRAGLDGQIRIDSAGTHDYHIGDPPDARAQQHAQRRGYDLSALRARQVTRADFSTFDYVIAMDRANRLALERLSPERRHSRIHLFLTFADGVTAQEVPDPYYGGSQGFETVLDLVENAAAGLLRHILVTDLKA
jgi:protein-tyrosine phosphatase